MSALERLRRGTRLVIGGLALLVAGCAASPSPTPARAVSAAQAAPLRAALEALVAAGRIPGAEVLIARDGIIAAMKERGL